MWPSNSGYHLDSSQSICACLKMLLFLRKSLSNMAPICLSPTKISRRVFSRSRTELEIRRGCVHLTLDIILPHHNESVHVLKCSYFFVNLVLTSVQYCIIKSHLILPYNFVTFRD